MYQIFSEPLSFFKVFGEVSFCLGFSIVAFCCSLSLVNNDKRGPRALICYGKSEVKFLQFSLKGKMMAF